MTEMKESIFKAYDIRGIYPDDIDEEIFYSVGRIFPIHLLKTQNEIGSKKIVLGRDGRTSSEPLSKAFAEGVLDSGFDIIELGQVTSPMFYFAVSILGAFGGAYITASHNPSQYNGIKFVKKEAAYVGGDELKKMHKMASGKIPGPKKRGKITMADRSEEYLDYVAKGFSAERKLKVVVDASSGVTGLFLDRLMKKLGIECVPIFFEMDGSFSKHDPNPSLAESQIPARKKVLETGADLAVIFDGDGDRAFFLDEKGDLVPGDIAGAIVADSFLKKGDSVCQIMTATRAITDHFEKKGIRVEPVNVGRFFVFQKMTEKEIDFCSETSGHYYFKELDYSESAFLAFRMMLDALNKNPERRLSEMTKDFQVYSHSGEINLGIETGSWPAIFEKVKARYSEGKQAYEDGILAEFDGWWFNLRPSNTEPVIRFVVEGKTPEIMKEKKEEIIGLLESLGAKQK